jgi:cupin fold WbuC family metalloprotein
LAAPADSLTIIGADLLARAVEHSRQSPRGRIILPLHKSQTAILQRMLNAIQPGSYVQPHRHSHPPKDESIVVVQGRITLLTFHDNGRVSRRWNLAAGGRRFGADIEAGVFHTFYATAADTVLFEAKTGPYEPASDKDFAAWAPPEDSPDARAYLHSLTA